MTQSQSVDGAPPRLLRIATFNLENFGGETADSPSIDLRRDALLPSLLRLEADVLCLQEVNGQHVAGTPDRHLVALDHLLEGTPYAGFQRASTRAIGGVGALDVHNLVVLSRFPIREFNQVHHDLVPPLTYQVLASAGMEHVRWDRPFLHVACELPDHRPLHIINVHLRAPLAAYLPGQKQSAMVWKTMSGWAEGFFISAMKRAGQALEVRLYVDKLLRAEPDSLIAVCGDFNAEAGEMPVRIIRGDPRDSGNPALAGQALVAIENAAPSGMSYSVLHEGRRLLLDHILVSKSLALACRSLTIDNAALADEAAAPAGQEPVGSFHAPLMAMFELS